MSEVFEPFVVSDGHGPVVVLVHGSWTDHRTWDLLVPHLADSFQVVRYDRRGHSRSRCTAPVTRRQDEDDLGALIDALGAPVHVVANSYGAAIALGLAGRRPALVTSLAVHEPPLLGIARPGTPLSLDRDTIMDALDGVAAEIRRGRPDDAARRFVDEVALGPGSWAVLPADVRAAMVANAHTFAGTLADPDWAAIVDVIRPCVPLLVSDGAASPAWLRLITAEIVSCVAPHAERLTLTTAGHVPHLTRPAEYAHALRHFIGTVTTSAPLDALG